MQVHETRSTLSQECEKRLREDRVGDSRGHWGWRLQEWTWSEV